MNEEHTDQVNFFSEISEYQISAREFFSTVLLDYLAKNFGWEKVLISYFDTQGKFLSWTSWQGIAMDSKEHPYRIFFANDVIRHIIYQDALRDQLTYFNVAPRLYKSTDIITEQDYEHSAYVRFIEENFQQHYSTTLAFGMNGYIQVTFFKTLAQGDFTTEEIAHLNEIYVYLANSYKNFKKYEQAKIVQNIQNKVIASGEKAYLVTDDFMHIMSYSQTAVNCLTDILGPVIADQISSTTPCSWLPFLLSGEEGAIDSDRIQIKIIKNYVFKIYTYDQTYSNGIIDRYHWITIAKKDEEKKSSFSLNNLPLTATEQRVAELMYQGLTYKAIADKLVVSYHTIKKHVQNIYTKCGVNSRFELYKLLENHEE